MKASTREEDESIKMRDNYADDQTTIDIMELLNLLWRKAWLLALCFVSAAALVGVYTKCFVTPLYSATSMIYVVPKTTDPTSTEDLQLGTQLASDYQMLGKSRLVVEGVIEKLGLTIPYDKLSDSVEITNPTDTHFLRISISNPDPALAAAISNAMAEELSIRVAEVMVTEKPTLAEVAVPGEKPDSPDLFKNMMIGGLIGFFVSAAILLLRYFMDDTIKTSEDIERYLSINILAVIPIDEHQKTRKRRQKKVARTKREHVPPNLTEISVGQDIEIKPVRLVGKQRCN